MIAPIYRQSFWVLFPGQGVHYIWMLFLVLMSFKGSNNPAYDFPAIGFIIAIVYLAFITGSTLTDLLVKPLTFCLPRKQQALGWMIPLYGLVYCTISALLFLWWWGDSVRITTPAEFVSVMLLALALFQVVVFCVLHTTSANYVFLLVTCLAMFSYSPGVAGTLQQMFRFFLEYPLGALALATGASLLTVRAFDKDLLRTLCGQYFLSFGAMMNPNREMEVTARRRRQLLQRKRPLHAPSALATTVPSAGSRQHSALHSVMDELVELGRRRNWTMIGVWLVVIPLLWVSGGDFTNGIGYMLLLFPLFLILSELKSFFRRPVSPLLPASRARYFRETLYKAGILYGLAIILLLIQLLLLAALRAIIPEMSSGLQAATSLPLKSVLWFALLVPAFVWAHLTLRSVFAIVVFAMLLITVSMASTFMLIEAFLQLHLVLMLLITFLAWLPFLARSWYVAFRQDLLVQ
jgi:hypothetical protein